jgi:hypothetical protein
VEDDEAAGGLLSVGVEVHGSLQGRHRGIVVAVGLGQLG